MRLSSTRRILIARDMKLLSKKTVVIFRPVRRRLKPHLPLNAILILGATQMRDCWEECYKERW